MAIVSSAPDNTTTPLVPSRIKRKPHRRSILLFGFDAEALLMGLTTFALNLYMVYRVVFQVGFFFVDAAWRTYAVWRVFFGNDPKLANIGFVWVPLPALLQFPLVLLPALRYKGLSGNVVTAAMGAGAALVLLVLLRRLRIPVILRWLIVAAFMLNPMIWIYSANGMSEIIFIFFLLLAIYCYYRWHDTNGRWTFLTGCGLAMTGAFLSRYESIILIIIFSVIIAWQVFIWDKYDLQRIESTILVYGAPIAYFIFLWLAANYLIMDDPLYFVRGEYSNAGTIGFQLTGIPWALPIKGNLLASVQTILIQTWQIFPAFFLLSGVLLIAAIAKRAWIGLYTLGIAWSFIGFPILNLYLGQSTMHVRYLINVIPMAFVMGVSLLRLVTRWRGLVAILLCLTFALSDFSSFNSMWNLTASKYAGTGEDLLLRSLISGQRAHLLDDEQILAVYILNHTRGKILVDDSQGTYIVFFAESPERFIVQGDLVFESFLKEPFHNVNYILINEPVGVGSVNLVNRAYPNLYLEGSFWTRLEQKSGTWKLYRVIGSPNKVR